jgi:hypothetical protein
MDTRLGVVDIVNVDPRDQRVEIEHPTYRVYFWSEGGRRSDEYELTGAHSVAEVIEWAESQAGTRRVVIYLAVPTTDGMVLGRLHGSGQDAV